MWLAEDLGRRCAGTRGDWSLHWTEERGSLGAEPAVWALPALRQVRSPWASWGCQSSSPRRELCPGPSQPAQRYPGSATVLELQSCLWSPLSCPDVCPDSSLSCPYPAPGGLLARSPPSPALTVAASPTDTPLPLPAHPLGGSSPVLPTIRAPDLGSVPTPATPYIQHVGFCLRAWRSLSTPHPLLPGVVQQPPPNASPCCQCARQPLQMEGVFFKYLLIYLGLCWVSIAACGLPLVAESGGHSPVGVRRLLTAVASLAAERGLPAHAGPRPWGSRALEGALSSCGAQVWLLRGTCSLLEPGIEPRSLVLQGALLNDWTTRGALQM